jgi:hypothetical protein
VIWFVFTILGVQQLIHAWEIHRLKQEYHLMFLSLVNVSKTADTVLEMWVEHRKEHM